MQIVGVPNIGVDSKGVPYLIDQPDNENVAVGTVLNSALLTPLLQEVYNAITLSGLTPSSDNTQLYSLFKDLRESVNNVAGSVNSIGDLTNALNQVKGDLAKVKNLLGNSGNTLDSYSDKLNGLLTNFRNLPGMNTQATLTSTLDTYDESYRLNAKLMVAIKLVQKQIYLFIKQKLSQLAQEKAYLNTIFQYPENPSDTPTFDFFFGPNKSSHLSLQNDGNLVIYKDGKPVFAVGADSVGGLNYYGERTSINGDSVVTAAGGGQYVSAVFGAATGSYPDWPGVSLFYQTSTKRPAFTYYEGGTRNSDGSNLRFMDLASIEEVPEYVGPQDKVLEQAFIVNGQLPGNNGDNARITFPRPFRSGTTPVVTLTINREGSAQGNGAPRTACIANVPGTGTPDVDNTGFSFQPVYFTPSGGNTSGIAYTLHVRAVGSA